MCALVNDEIPSLVFPLYSLVGTGYQPIPEVFSQHQMMYPENGVRKQPLNRNLSISSTSLFVTHLLVTCLLALMAASTVMAHDDSLPHQGNPPLHAQDIMRAFAAEHHHNEQLPSQAVTSCVGGFAGSYPCSNVDLMAFLPLAQIGGGNGNDIWGWTDSTTGREYAIMGLTNGTAFVDVTDPVNPVYLGHLSLPSGVLGSSWRDIKVFADHVYIGSEALGSGLQVMDLAQLRNVPTPPVSFVQTALYDGYSTSHNIVMNEDTGFAYAVGINNGNCGRGLHFVDLINPASPQQAGCFGDDGYTHDAQCVIYNGPDTGHQGKEICFAYNVDTLTVVDVSTKSAPIQISRTPYFQNGYSHQGWLTEDHAFILMDDESDEQTYGGNTRTIMWDMSDLDMPVYMGYYSGVASSIDHNQYIKGNFSYQANYRSGLRVLDITDIAAGNLTEVAFFDIYPANDSANFNGAWSVYPFFDSGTVVVSGIEQGLFILRLTLGPPSEPPQVDIDNPLDGSIDLSGVIQVQIDATDAEDPAGSLNVEWNINGGSWQNTSYSGGFYLASWDSASVLDGSHTLNARAIDDGWREGSDSSSFTVANGSPEFTVDSVQVSITPGNGNRNRGYAVMTVVDDGGDPLGGVLVEGNFSGGWSGQRSGTTTSDGQVSLNTPKVKNLKFVQYCVENASKAGWAFNSTGSTLCGDSNGGGGDVGVIDGRVIDAGTAAGIANASLTIDSGQNATSDNNGDYTVVSVPVGNRTVTVTANGYTGQNQATTVSESATSMVNFALTPTPSGGAGSIKGTVRSSSGPKLSGVMIEVQGGSSANTNNGGKYNLQNVTEGTRTITASKTGFMPQVQQVMVSAGGSVTLNFTLSPDP